jgi:hypothetical protein
VKQWKGIHGKSKRKKTKHLKHQMKSKRRIHQVVIGRMKNNNNKKKGFLFFVGVLIVMDLENL